MFVLVGKKEGTKEGRRDPGVGERQREEERGEGGREAERERREEKEGRNCRKEELRGGRKGSPSSHP